MDWTSIIAIVISVVAVAISAWGLKHARVSAEAARRSAEAAERQAAAAESALPPTPPPVWWEIAHRGQDSYVLRNRGSQPAEEVQIDDLGGLMHVEGGDIVEPGGSVSFWIVRVAEAADVNEIRARWEGSGGWVIVPLP